jgi:CheY-like chemotaxis protein
MKSDHFAAIILDLGLDDMTGFEWLDHIAEVDSAHPPVIVYSARELSKDELLHLRSCTETVITKGKHSNELLREELLLALRTTQPVTRAPKPPSAGNERHLLLVDDDVRNLYALSKALRGRGFRVTVAEDGEHALTALRADRFDAVLTDIMMPGIDGYELMRRIRSMGYTDLPLIAVTAKAMQGDQTLCIQAGANGYIPKPVDIDRLIDVLKDCL